MPHIACRGPATFYRLLSEHPEFFAEVIGTIYRPRHPDQDEDAGPEPNAAARIRARHLLRDWPGVPGQRGDGTLDADEFRDWVLAARRLLHASGHAAVGDRKIGIVLARVLQGADRVWPCECVRELLEAIRSDDLDRGVFFGVLNGRGLTWWSPAEGGGQELRLAERYASRAAALAVSAPRASKILGWIADNYRAHGKHEDDRRVILWRETRPHCNIKFTLDSDLFGRELQHPGYTRFCSAVFARLRRERERPSGRTAAASQARTRAKTASSGTSRKMGGSESRGG